MAGRDGQQRSYRAANDPINVPIPPPPEGPRTLAESSDAAAVVPQRVTADGSRLRCPVCQVTLPAIDWPCHAKGTSHACMVQRAAMEASGVEGVTPPPPGVEVPNNHVWCGGCQVAVGIRGDIWRKNIASAAHVARRRVAAGARHRPLNIDVR